MNNYYLGNVKQAKYLKEYKNLLAASIAETLKRIIKDIRKGIQNILDDNVFIYVYNIREK